MAGGSEWAGGALQESLERKSRMDWVCSADFNTIDGHRNKHQAGIASCQLSPACGPEAGQYPQACGGVWWCVVACGVLTGGSGQGPGTVTWTWSPTGLGDFLGNRPLCPLLRPSAPWWVLGLAGRAGPILCWGVGHSVFWSAISALWAAGMNAHLSSPEPRPLL